MLIHQRPRVTAGRIAFEFESLPVRVGECHGTVVGTAYIGYDGRGAWWLDQLALSNPQAYGPSHYVPVGHPIFAEVRERLDQYRDDDIGEAIERALTRGAHQRLFDEHRPHAQDLRGAPPHARRARFLGIGLSGVLQVAASLAGATAEMACLGLFLGGIYAGMEAVQPGARGQAHRIAVVAKLEMPGDRP